MIDDNKGLEYITNEGIECPFCGSDNLTWGDPYFDGNSHYQRVDCDMCKKAWWDIYSLAGIDEIDE